MSISYISFEAQCHNIGKSSKLYFSLPRPLISSSLARVGTVATNRSGHYDVAITGFLYTVGPQVISEIHSYSVM